MERRPESVERAWSATLADATPAQILLWAADTFGDRLTLACSFGGTTGMVLLHLARQAVPGIDVFTIDTGFLFPETIALRERVAGRFALNLRVLTPAQTPAEQAAAHGDALWERDPDRCCALRKVEPAVRALSGRDAWVTGVRRDQARTRESVEPIAWDAVNGLYKIAPLWNWTEAQVLEYARENDVPLNPLHDDGYPSIGCTHCTRRVADGDDLRAGRWAGTGKTECGLHLRPARQKEVA